MMLKKITLASFAVVLLSCGRDSDNVETNTAPILVTKENHILSNGVLESYLTYTYNGDKIVKTESSDGEEKVEFTYNGDEISKSIIYLNDKITQINEYFYTNGKLTSQKVTESRGPIPYSFIINYNYINDNHVKFTRVTGYSSNSSNIITSYSYTDYDVFLSNGNLNNTVENSTSGGTVTHTYTYDDKNNPYKNIKGYIKAMMFSSIDGDYGMNNLTKENIDSSHYTANTSNIYTYIYTYNSNNFPTKIATAFTSNVFPNNTHTITFEYNK